MYAPVVPSKTIPDFRPKWAKCFQTKRPKTPTLPLYTAVPPPPPLILTPFMIVRDRGCVRLGNLDLDFKIPISDLQSNSKCENGFQR